MIIVVIPFISLRMRIFQKFSLTLLFSMAASILDNNQRICKLWAKSNSSRISFLVVKYLADKGIHVSIVDHLGPQFIDVDTSNTLPHKHKITYNYNLCNL